MKTSLIAITLAAAVAGSIAVPASAQSRGEEQRWRSAQQRFEDERRLYERERQRYEMAARRDEDYRRYGERDRYETDYDAVSDYREDPRYGERVLGAEDEVYRGSDGRYYCRRSDGTTGLIVGGAAGGVLGNVIDGGRSRTAGTLIGGALGALLGREVERQQVRCR